MFKIAEELVIEDNRIIDQMGIRETRELRPYLGGSKKVWETYQKLVGRMLRKKGFSKSKKVPIKVRDMLEDWNYHSLNQAIDFLGYGEGRYGLSRKAFFSAEEYFRPTRGIDREGQKGRINK